MAQADNVSELAPVEAVLPGLRMSLAARDASGGVRVGGTLYTQRRGRFGLLADDPEAPYFLIRAAASPEAPPGGALRDATERFFLDGWGTWDGLAVCFGRLAWLEGWREEKFGGAFNIRYGLMGETARDPEPEIEMPDGREMYHFANLYQARYLDLSRLSRRAGSLARAP